MPEERLSIAQGQDVFAGYVFGKADVPRRAIKLSHNGSPLDRGEPFVRC